MPIIRRLAKLRMHGAMVRGASRDELRFRCQDGGARKVRQRAGAAPPSREFPRGVGYRGRRLGRRQDDEHPAAVDALRSGAHCGAPRPVRGQAGAVERHVDAAQARRRPPGADGRGGAVVGPALAVHCRHVRVRRDRGPGGARHRSAADRRRATAAPLAV